MQQQINDKKEKQDQKPQESKKKSKTEFELPEVTEVIAEATQILEQPKPVEVCRVCGREDCYCYPRIPQEDYVPGKYAD